MWDIYLENPNTYKVKQHEYKRIQAIDRKLKQYSSIQKTTVDHYKTIDLSQLDRNKTKMDNHGTFLLRDAGKFDPANTSFNSSNGYSLTSHLRENRSHQTLVNNIWNQPQSLSSINNNNNNNNNLTHKEPIIVESKIFGDSNEVNSNVHIYLQPEEISANELKAFNSKRRFTIEKTKDLI